MRIVLTCPIPPDRHGAGAIPRLLDALVGELARRHDVVVVTSAGPDADSLAAVADLRAAGLDVRCTPRLLCGERLSWPRRMEIVQSLVRERVPWRTAWFHDPAISRHLADVRLEGAIDMFHAEDNAVAMYDYSGAPSVLTEYEVRRDRGWARPPTPRAAAAEVDWRRWRRYQRRAWRRFDRLQAVSDRDARLMADMVPDMAGAIDVNPFAVVMPPGADPAAHVPGEILFMGNYAHAPNVDAAVWLAQDVLPRVLARRPDARLTLVGDAAPPAIRALAGGPVTFAGRVADPDAWFARAAVVAAPVRTGGGMRMKVLDALAHGKAVVTTTRGREGLGDAPLRWADDADGIAREIAGLLGDRDARDELGRRARQDVERRFSPAAHVDRLEETYARARHAYARRHGWPT